jgi:hypothetical protein
MLPYLWVSVNIPKLTEVESGLNKAGVDKPVGEIRSQWPEKSSWPSIFTHAWLASTLDEVSWQDPEIRGFIGSTHSRYVDEFTRLDEERIDLAADRVRSAHREKAISAMNTNAEGEQLMRAEAAKVTRHLPLRRVFARAADVVSSLPMLDAQPPVGQPAAGRQPPTL